MPFDNRPWAGTRDRRTFRSSEHRQRRNTGCQAQVKTIQMKEIQVKKVQSRRRSQSAERQ